MVIFLARSHFATSQTLSGNTSCLIRGITKPSLAKICIGWSLHSSWVLRGFHTCHLEKVVVSSCSDHESSQNMCLKNSPGGEFQTLVASKLLALSHHLSRPTLQLLQNDPLRPGVDKSPLSPFKVVAGGTLRTGNDRVTPDKPPQFATVVCQAFFSISQLQRHSPSDNCIQILDLQFAVCV